MEIAMKITASLNAVFISTKPAKLILYGKWFALTSQKEALCLGVMAVDVNQTYNCPQNHLIFSCCSFQHIAALRADLPPVVIALLGLENMGLINNWSLIFEIGWCRIFQSLVIK